MAKGRVYWLTGLHNSGKTTIGTTLYYDLKKNMDNIVILDGDIMKNITSFHSDNIYSTESRFSRAKRYSVLSKLLSDQGIVVIVCTISMYDEIREWNRKNIKGYIEVYISAPEEIRRERSKNKNYSLDSNIQLPKNPDLIVNNDGMTPLRDIVSQIKIFHPESEEDFDRDKDYWNKFYKSLELEGELSRPSQFAQDIIDMLEPGRHLLELGCGNGRDSLFFLKNGIRVTAIDASDIAINHLNQMAANDDNALFVCDNFVKCQSLYQLKYDYIYSRFTLHAINEDQENELLLNIYEGLCDGGMLFIEARSTKDEIFGLGVEVEKNAFFYNGHYRRFIDINDFRGKLLNYGFEIVQLEERKGFSRTETSDPVLLRCIAKKCDK